ncbi:recombinase family protein [Limosilactobacillus fermentum]|uniref:recombinase family protein n=1 Tax=Limosilactobacillus fermentum TaxID=1613 RepID=UPI00097314B8|nr:recombinase family protein [Limosilactobacillus fermentum]WNY96338.1 recombinase family protein [Limosilactobacillus fermentum]BAW87288.1 integrase [Limosilactobacillus fermentum]
MGKVRIIPAHQQKGNSVHHQRNSQPFEKLRVAAYCRVSTDYDEQASSYETQVAHYKELIQKEPTWEFAGIYADDGISGTNTKKREQFNKMIAACKAGKIDLIVTKSISRFARNTIDCLKYIRDLKAINVAIFFEKENINTMDAKGEVLITIMASLAQQESESLSQNVKMGIQYRYQQGKVFVNHNHFLGYTKDTQGNLVIEPEEAKVIKRIFYSYLNGMTMKQIADALKADGILTGGKTKNWRSSSIAKILKNEKYMGDALLQKTYTVDFLNKKRVKNEGIMPQYYVENDHPAIIPKSVFMQVQQIIKQRRNGITTKNGKHRRLNGKYCFSQKLFCGKCGDILQRNMWYRPEKVAVWRCASRIKRSKTGRRCMIRNIKEPLLKEATIEAFNQLIEGHELANKQIKANIMKIIENSKGPTLDQIDQQLEEVQMKLIQAANQHQDCDALTQQIMDLRKQKEKVQSRETDQQAKLHSLDEINKLVELHKYGLVDFDEQLIRRLVEKITIFQRYMEFTFKDGEVIRVNM